MISSATARKTWIFNELADRNTRDKENGVMSLSFWHVKRKNLTSLFGTKRTINEMILGGSGGDEETTGFVLLSRIGRTAKPLKVGCGLEVAQIRGA
ncbi:hypothetical protein N7508_010137 [Penicillium antarcticum]|uniref:uncharacterized protein n=1 Tax=Penicillium antarcticum TaxID=416450 RepID=UPI00238C4179|nr:uncharacterized protein N7508_010137 [Penicillium antarcticum]KAJ5295316.1 hypothetical protein N7508_010137 [Penicillium antarcticum]